MLKYLCKGYSYSIKMGKRGSSFFDFTQLTSKYKLSK